MADDDRELVVGGIGYGLPDSGLDFTAPTMHDIDGVQYRDEDAKRLNLGPYADDEDEGQDDGDDGQPADAGDDDGAGEAPAPVKRQRGRR